MLIITYKYIYIYVHYLDDNHRRVKIILLYLLLYAKYPLAVSKSLQNEIKSPIVPLLLISI